jgi:hypothetical protein
MRVPEFHNSDVADVVSEAFCCLHADRECFIDYSLNTSTVLTVDLQSPFDSKKCPRLRVMRVE